MALMFTPDHDHTAIRDEGEEQLIGWVYFTVQNRPGDFMAKVNGSSPPKTIKLPRRKAYLGPDGHLYKDETSGDPFRLVANDPEFNLDHLTYRVDFELTTLLGDPVEVPHTYFPAPSTDTTMYLTRVMPDPDQPVMEVRTKGYVEDILDASSIGVEIVTAVDAEAATDLFNVATYVRVTKAGAVGNGIANDTAAFVSADTDAQAGKLSILVDSGTYKIASDVTITSPVVVQPGALIKPASGKTVVLAGGLNAPMSKVFDLSAGGAVVVKNAPALYPQWWGAIGDDTANDQPAIQAAFDAASAAASTAGQRVKVIIPAGTYRCNGWIYVSSNTTIENQGHLKFYGGNAIGEFVTVFAASNVEIYGGIWDSNHNENANTIGIGNVDFAGEVAGPACENVWIHHCLLKNSAHGGSHLADVNDPVDIGRGGGKAITVQFGNKDILISDVVVDNCDLGISVEGKESDAGYSQGVVIQNSIIKNCKYLGLYLTSVGNTGSLYGTVTSLSLSNVELVDCGVGQTNEESPRDIATLFGAITSNYMIGVKATNVRVRSTTGKLTVLRGSMRSCDWDVQVFAGGELVNLVDSTPYGGYNPASIVSRWNSLRAKVIILGTTFTGYLVKSDATYGASCGEYDVSFIWLNGGTPVGMDAARYSSNLPSNSVLSVTDLNSGRRALVNHGGAVTADSPWSNLLVNGLAIDDQAGSDMTKIGPTRTYLSLAGSDGSSQAVVKNGTFNILNRLGFASDSLGAYWGTGSPEGVVTAAAGSVYFNSSGGDGTTIYQKASGSGDTGWKALATLTGTETHTNKTLTTPTLTTPAINGTATGTGVSSAATASTLALRDSNANLTSDAFIPSKTSTATAAGTTTLTIADTQVQVFTGTSTQTVKLPTTGVTAGMSYIILNNSTGAVTVQASDAGSLNIIGSGRFGVFTAAIDTPVSASDWRRIVPTTDGTQAGVIPMTDTGGWLGVSGLYAYRNSTATSGGTLTMSSSSAQVQLFTGSTTHTVKLPSSNIYAGMQYTVVNQSSGSVTVQSSGANTVATVTTGTAQLFVALKDSPTAAADWRAI